MKEIIKQLEREIANNKHYIKFHQSEIEKHENQLNKNQKTLKDMKEDTKNQTHLKKQLAYMNKLTKHFFYDENRNEFLKVIKFKSKKYENELFCEIMIGPENKVNIWFWDPQINIPNRAKYGYRRRQALFTGNMVYDYKEQKNKKYNNYRSIKQWKALKELWRDIEELLVDIVDNIEVKLLDYNSWERLEIGSKKEVEKFIQFLVKKRFDFKKENTQKQEQTS